MSIVAVAEKPARALNTVDWLIPVGLLALAFIPVRCRAHSGGDDAGWSRGDHTRECSLLRFKPIPVSPAHRQRDDLRHPRCIPILAGLSATLAGLAPQQRGRILVVRWPGRGALRPMDGNVLRHRAS